MPVQAEMTGRVVAVTGGDTIDVESSNHIEHHIRLSGINAPLAEQPYGPQSREHLARLLDGKEVMIEYFAINQHGEIVARVWVQPDDCSDCDKTLDANLAQLTAGMAWWDRFNAGKQSEEDQGRYESAEDEAKARHWGLWTDPHPINPQDWKLGERQADS